MTRFALAALTALALAQTLDAGPLRRRAQSAPAQPAALSQPIPAAMPGPGPTTAVPDETGAVDALDEVNAARAARGLRPFVRDPLLSAGAARLAVARARVRLFGHFTGGAGDFAYLPPGANAAVTGCAAYPASYGWMSCAVYDNYTYAGAAWAMGADGKRYMHLVAR